MHLDAEHHEAAQRNIGWAAVLNLVLAGVEAVAFFRIANILTIGFGALHDFGDFGATSLSYYLQKWGRKKVQWLTVSNFFNAGAIFISSGVVVGGAVWRLIHQENVSLQSFSWELLGLGVFNVTFNSIIYLRLEGGHTKQESLISGHYLDDILSGIGMIVVDLAAPWFNPAVLDPIVVIVIAVFVSVRTLRRLRAD